MSTENELDYLPKGSKKGKAYAYVRRSVADRSGKPLISQILAIEKYVKEYGKQNLEGETTINTFYGDNGVAGSMPVSKRPGLNSFFNDVKGKNLGKIHLIVFCVSRLSRTANCGTEINKELSNINAVLHIASTFSVITGPEQTFIFTINLFMAQNERRACIERTRTALRHKDWDPRVGYGYELVDKVKKEIPSEQKVLKIIKDLYENEGKLVVEIAKILNTQGFKRRDEGNWTGRSVGFICKRNEFVFKEDSKFIEDDKNIILIKDKTDLLEKIQKYKENDEENHTPEGFLKSFDGAKLYFNGVKLIKSSLTNYIQSPEQKAMFDRLTTWIEEDIYSNDDLIEKLNDEFPKKEGKSWTPQAAWNRIKIIRDNIEAKKKKK